MDKNIHHVLDVLDDFKEEAKQVYDYNCWLTYGLPLHRIREFGTSNEIFDALDERLLGFDEMRQLCEILFDQGLPNPEDDWANFLVAVESLNDATEETWCSIDHIKKKWIDIDFLEHYYGEIESP